MHYLLAKGTPDVGTLLSMSDVEYLQQRETLALWTAETSCNFMKTLVLMNPITSRHVTYSGSNLWRKVMIANILDCGICDGNKNTCYDFIR